MSEHDVPAGRGRDELRDAIASALYNEFRVGKMPDYRPMWHEVEEATRAKYRAMTNELLGPFAALLAPQGAREGEAKCSIHLNVGGALYGCVLPGGHAGPHDFRTAARPAPETREPELLGYVVERQHTPGEWVRVWRGSTMWFDHDEAVLDRDAYALDGIPARIRPVYLGAPAPADSATSEEGAGDAE